jgi:hypothetical protein
VGRRPLGAWGNAYKEDQLSYRDLSGFPVRLRKRTTTHTEMQTATSIAFPPGSDSSNHVTILQFTPILVYGTRVTFAWVLSYLLPNR